MISAHLIISINITAIIGCSSPPKVQLTISQKKTGAGLLRPGVWIQNPRVIWVWWSPSMRKRWWVLDGPKGRKSVAMVQPRASQGKCQRRKSQKKMRERRWSRRTWRSWKILQTCWSSWRVAGGALQVVEDESDCWGFCSARSQRSVWNLAKPKQGWWWMHVDASSLAGCKTQFPTWWTETGEVQKSCLSLAKWLLDWAPASQHGRTGSEISWLRGMARIAVCCRVACRQQSQCGSKKVYSI